MRKTLRNGAVVTVRDGERVVCERCVVAASALARMRGLLGRSSLAPGEGILITRTGSVHTLFMRFAIDVVFLDGDGGVRRVRADLAPWRAAWSRGAKTTIELAAGEAARRAVRPGTRLSVDER
jgi:uncharacterized protein